jgi:multisubunit Na+/H+ antiporter MnhG subunit
MSQRKALLHGSNFPVATLYIYLDYEFLPGMAFTSKSKALLLGHFDAWPGSEKLIAVPVLATSDFLSRAHKFDFSSKTSVRLPTIAFLCCLFSPASTPTTKIIALALIPLFTFAGNSAINADETNVDMAKKHRHSDHSMRSQITIKARQP